MPGVTLSPTRCAIPSTSPFECTLTMKISRVCFFIAEIEAFSSTFSATSICGISIEGCGRCGVCLRLQRCWLSVILTAALLYGS